MAPDLQKVLNFILVALNIKFNLRIADFELNIKVTLARSMKTNPIKKTYFDYTTKFRHCNNWMRSNAAL